MTTIYLDLDGVLADFDGSFQTHFGMRPAEFEATHGVKKFWKAVFSVKDFFLHLRPMANYMALVQGVIAHGYKPIILTGLPAGEENGRKVTYQKRQWVDIFLGPQFDVITCMSRAKAEFCKPGDVLIDDRTKYISNWEKAGGKYIVHTSVEQSLNDLDMYLETGL